MKRKSQLESSAPTPDLVAHLLKIPFSRRSLLQTKENNWERKILILISLTKVSKVFMRHFKDCNYECYEWLTVSTEHKLFCWPCSYFLIQVKGHGMTDPWTLFTGDSWVLYYLTSFVSCTLLWRCTWCVDNTVVWCVAGCPTFVQFCCFGCVVILEWCKCAQWPVYWWITFTEHVEKFTLHLTDPNIAYVEIVDQPSLLLKACVWHNMCIICIWLRYL